MAKKRAKSKVSQANESTEMFEPTCTHIRKGLEQGNLKKALPVAEWNVCQDCQIDNKAKENMEEEMVEIPSVWLCLKCGHRGCDRNSQEKHALQHYNTPRSDCHCLVLNLDNWSVWCYLCDDEVPYSSSNRLGQLVDFVRKETNKQSRVQTSDIVLKEQEQKELENKKLQKDSKNEKEKVKNVSERNEENEILSMDTNVEVTVKGLSNLGNTCFFNAVMQNLSQTPVLRELLKEVKMTGTTITVQSLDSPRNEPLLINLEQLPGSLTSSMCQFLTEIQETKKGTVTPKELFSQVCKKAVRFKGYQQQDSQELLRYLLDGMRAEEIQRVKVGIIKSINDSANKIDAEEEIKRKANEYEKKRVIPNFVDRIFGGELSSTIMCDECRTVSLVHESFLDLSLPVLDEQAVKKGPNQKNATVIPEKKSEEDDDNESYVKEKSDSPPGTSKHLQKKAKKQAKKQAKNQRRQHKVLHLSDLTTADEKSEVDQNGYEETSSLEETHLENDNQKQEVEFVLQSVDHSLVLKNVNGENETDVLSAHENGKSPVQDDLETVTKMEGTFEILDATEHVNKLDSLILEKGNLCLVKGGSCLEKGNPCLEEGSPCLNNSNSCFEEGSLCLKEDRPFLEGDWPCLEKGSPCLEKDSSCLEQVKPYLEQSHLCLEKGSPCLEKGSPCFEEGSTSLEEVNSSSEKGSPSSGKGSPSLEKGSEGVDDLVSGFDKLHLRAVVEPHDIHVDILDSCHASETKLYEVVNEDPETAFCTLADRATVNTDECSVESCLYQFTRNEKLSETNKLLCNVCTRKRYSRLNSNVKDEKKHVYTNAKKQMLISLAPPILTLHLKRFQQAGVNLRKVNRHIKFPELIDLAPFCTVKCKNVAEGDTRVLYSLYGVVEHSGTMRSGHYTAFIKVRRPNTRLSDLVIQRVIPQALETEPLKGQWYHISDSHVQAVPLNRVLNSQAYLLFYERIL